VSPPLIDPQQLPPLFELIEPYMFRYGYWAVFLTVLLEDFGLPVPGETALVAASLFAAYRTGFDIELVALLGFLGAVIGDNVGFLIGTHGGKPMVLRYGKYVFLTEARYRRWRRIWERHGPIVIVLARFVNGPRQFNGIIAGSAGMRWDAFLLYNVVGAALWVAFWVVLTHYLAGALVSVLRAERRLGLWVVSAIVALAVASIIYNIIDSRRHHPESP
jgi:membrane protein DedA with SNARE-associated domain